MLCRCSSQGRGGVSQKGCRGAGGGREGILGTHIWQCLKLRGGASARERKEGIGRAMEESVRAARISGRRRWSAFGVQWSPRG